MRLHTSLAFGLVLSFAAGSAMATTTTTCPGGLTYDAGNGSSSLPGYNVGIVGPAADQYCQFGNLGDTTTLADPAVVNDLVDNRQNKKVAAKAGA